MALFLRKGKRVAINTGFFKPRLQELPREALPVIRRMGMVIGVFVLLAASLPHQIYWQEEYALISKNPWVLLLIVLTYALMLVLVYMLTMILLRWVTGPWPRVKDPEGWRNLRRLGDLDKSER